MRRTFVNTTAKTAAVLIITLLMSSSGAPAQDGTKVNSAGVATLTTSEGLSSSMRFGLTATIRPDGSDAHVNFVFPLPFALVWGAVPGVDLIHIGGRVTSGQVTPDGTVIQAAVDQQSREPEHSTLARSRQGGIASKPLAVSNACVANHFF
jgi:hypothetical protein